MLGLKNGNMIKITLKEYKELRDKIEEYYILLNEYNTLAYQYQLLVKQIQPKQVQQPVKKKIGFD